MGRKSKFDDELKSKLKDAFSLGLNDREACLRAGITTRRLYNYFSKRKRFKEECDLLKCNLRMHAKLNIAHEIIDNKDLATSKYYLERNEDKDEEASHDGITFREDIPLSDNEERFGENYG